MVRRLKSSIQSIDVDGQDALRATTSADRGDTPAASNGSSQGTSHGAGPTARARPAGALVAHHHRRRWLSDQLRKVPHANPLQDTDLLGRVRDRLRELPDEPGEAAQADQSDGPDLAAIRDSFEIVGAAGDMAASYFYGRLFVNQPRLRELFPPAMDEQRDRLFRSLTRIVRSLSTPEEMASYLAQLGRDHRKYEVTPEMYAAVGDALIATLRAFAGDAFTPPVERSWVSAYGAASALMIRAADEAGSCTPAFWPAEVVQHERRSHGIATLTVAPDQPLLYQAGQHVTVQTGRWPRVWRPYSIACRPREDGLLRFHVKAVSGGWVSTALVDHTRVGDQLTLGPAVGNMTLAAAAKRDLLCVAGGTGLAPLKAIAEQVVYEESRHRNHRNVILFYGTRTEGEQYDLQDLWRLCDSCPWLQVQPVISGDPAYHGMQGNVGRVAARYLPHADCEAYVAGPAAMVRETIAALKKAGMAQERIHYDDGVLASRHRVGSGT